MSADEFKACLKICDRDHSGEIDYREFARAVKYGDPRRIQSMQEQQRKLERLRNKGLKKKGSSSHVDEHENENENEEKNESKNDGAELSEELLNVYSV